MRDSESKQGDKEERSAEFRSPIDRASNCVLKNESHDQLSEASGCQSRLSTISYVRQTNLLVEDLTTVVVLATGD